MYILYRNSTEHFPKNSGKNCAPSKIISFFKVSILYAKFCDEISQEFWGKTEEQLPLLSHVVSTLVTKFVTHRQTFSRNSQIMFRASQNVKNWKLKIFMKKEIIEENKSHETTIRSN